MSIVPTVSGKAAGGNIDATGAFLNAALAGTIIALDLEWNARIGKEKEIIIPTAETWTLTDLYYASTAAAGTDVNPVIEVKKDNDRLLDTTNRALSLLVTSNQRPNGLHANLQFEGGSHMTMNAISNAIAGAARTITGTMPYEKYG